MMGPGAIPAAFSICNQRFRVETFLLANKTRNASRLTLPVTGKLGGSHCSNSLASSTWRATKATR